MKEIEKKHSPALEWKWAWEQALFKGANVELSGFWKCGAFLKSTPALCYFLKCAYEKVRALDIENGVKYSVAKIPIGGKV